MYAAIPRAYLWVIPNADHTSVFGLPDRFAETTLAFLRGDWEE